MRSWGFTIAAALAALFFFALAISHAVYEATSPVGLSWHVLLRKTYSVAAFTIVAYLLRRALVERGSRAAPGPTCILALAAYSAAIEVDQFLHGSQEGLGWNAFDTCCGALGGAIATADTFVRRRSQG